MLLYTLLLAATAVLVAMFAVQIALIVCYPLERKLVA
jgi:hypothetical protein